MKESTATLPLSPLQVSAAFHLSLVALVFLIIQIWSTRSPMKVPIVVYENPVIAPKSLQIQTPPPPPPKKEIPKAVFGLSKAAHVDAAPADSTAVSVKAGNTIAKEVDNEKLKDDDPTRLPIPTDEYLVSSMPKLLSEVRVPYPEQARAKNVEGPVVMDLLIDKEGHVRQVTLVRGQGFGLDEAAQEAIKQFSFAPATTADGPVAVKIRYTYRFVLENR